MCHAVTFLKVPKARTVRVKHGEVRTAIQDLAIRHFAGQRRWLLFVPDFGFLARCGTMSGLGIEPACVDDRHNE
jgi:hypothetical protein